jgi:predicted permease
MHQIVNIIGPTFFVVVVGYLFGRISKANMGPLIDISMYVAVPALAFYSMVTSEIVIGEAAKVWAACLIIMAGTLVAALLLFGALRQKHSGLYLPIVFTNFINIPLPIIYLAFGAAGAAQAILMYIPQGLIMYSLGVYVASGEKDMKQGLRVMMRTPLIYAAILGLALNLLHVPIPEVVIGSVKLLGQAGVPLMLLILGVSIGRFRLTQIWLTVAASVIRVAGGFVFGLLAVWLLALTGVTRSVVLFEAAMPAAVFVSVLAAKYKNEEDLVSSVVLATTLMAIVVIPALLYFLT